MIRCVTLLMMFAVVATGCVRDLSGVFDVEPVTPHAVHVIEATPSALILEGVLEDGDTALTDGRYCDVYRIEAAAGTVLVQLNSAQLDPYIEVYALTEAGTRTRIARNNDGPSKQLFEHDAFVEFELGAPTTLDIVASSSMPTTGAYRLGVGTRDDTPRSDLIDRYNDELDSATRAERARALSRTVEHYAETLRIARELYCNDHFVVARCLNLLAIARQNTGRYTVAEPLFEDAIAMFGRLYPDRDHPDVAMALHNLAHIRSDLGRADQAEPLAERALAMNTRLYHEPDHPLIASSLNVLGHVRLSIGRLDEAASLFSDSLGMRRRLYQDRDHPQIASALGNLGATLGYMERIDEAQSLFAEVLEMRRRLYPDEDRLDVAMAMNNLASSLDSLGRDDEAGVLHREALAMRRRLFPDADHPDIASSLQSLGNMSRSQGEVDTAEAYLEEALAMYRRLYPGIDHPDIVDCLTDLARVRRGQRRLDDAEKLLSKALGMAGRLRLNVRADPESRALMSGYVDFALTSRQLAEVRFAMGDPAGAFDAAEKGRTGALMDLFELQAVGGLRGLLSSLPEERRRIVADAQTRESDLRTAVLEAQLVYRAASDSSDLTDAQRGRLREDVLNAQRALGDAVANTNRTLGVAVPAYRARGSDDLRSALAPGEVVLVYTWDAFDGLALLLDRDGVRGAFITEDTGTYVDEIGALIARTRSPGLTGGSVARTLGDALVPESLRPRLEEARRVIIIPDGPLSRLPLDLVVGRFAPDAGLTIAYGGTQYLDRTAVAASRRPARADGRADVMSTLSLARPQYEGSAPALSTPAPTESHADSLVAQRRLARSSLDAYRLMGERLTDLPGTELEARAIEAALARAGLVEGKDRVLLLGEDASLARLRAECERLQPRVLHIATHGLVGTRESPLESALALTPSEGDFGFLALDHLLREWPGVLSDCDLVVLSACDTAWGERTGDAEFALPWGFMLAGSTSVVASLWQVDDVSTALLMARFHEGRLGSFDEPRSIRKHTYEPGERMPTLDALDEAKHWLRTLTHDAVDELIADLPDYASRGTEISFNQSAPESDHPYAHPYYWAAFVLYGSPD